MKKYRQAVAAVVLRHDAHGKIRMLILHKPRKHDAWQLPQGGIEEGETPETAALREIKEEAGLDLRSTPKKSMHTYCYDFPPEFIQRYTPVNAGQHLCFVTVEAPSDAVVTVDQNEINDFRWVLPDELPAFNARKEYVGVVMRVIGEIVV